jgi:hypothetical protein
MKKLLLEEVNRKDNSLTEYREKEAMTPVKEKST